MAEVGFRNLRIPMKRTRSTAPSTARSVLVLCIVCIGLIIRAQLQRPETGKENKENNDDEDSVFWEPMDLEYPPTLKTSAFYPKVMGKISDFLIFMRWKNREEKPLVEVDSTSNSAYQSELQYCTNSANTNSREEESKRLCMRERKEATMAKAKAKQQNSGGRRDNAAKSFGDCLVMERFKRRNRKESMENKEKAEKAKYLEHSMEKAGSLKSKNKENAGSKEEKPLVEFDSANIKEYQSGLLEKTNSREESKRPCITEKVLGSVDSTTRISSTDFDAADNTAHLGRACQSGPVVSLSGNENRGEASKRECITERILGSEDLQQNSGGRRDNAAESFGAIYDPGIHTTHSLAQNSFEVVEYLVQRIFNKILVVDVIMLLRALLEVEKFSPPQEKYRENDEGKTPQDVLTEEGEKWMKDSASLFSIVVALVATISITMLGLIKINEIRRRRNSREESKRPCMTEKVLGSVDSTTRISSTDFDAADNSAHLVRPYQSGPAVSLSGNENKGEASKRECITKSILGSEDLQQNSGGRRDNVGKSFGAIYDPGIHTTHSLAQNSFEVVEALPTRKQPNDSVPLLSLGRLTLEGCVQEEKSQDLSRLMQIDGVEQRVTKSPRYLEGFTAQKWATRKGYSAGDKRSFEVSSLSMSPCTEADESGPAVSNSEKGSMREALKRDSLKDLRQHFGARRRDAAKGLCDSLAWKSFEGLDNLLLGEHSKSIRNLDRRRALTQKHCVQLKKSQDLPRSLLSDCSGELAAQSATGLLDGEHVPSLSEKKIARNTLKRKSRTVSVPSFLNHQQHVGRRWEDDVNILGAKRICRQLAIDLESTAKRNRRQHGTRRWPFKQSAIGLPDEGYMLSLSKKKIMRKTLKRKCRNMSVLSLEYHQHVDSKWEDSVNGIGGKVLQLAKHIYKQLVIHRVSRVKRIHRQHGIHWWPFQQNWATLKWYHSQNGRTRDQPEDRNGKITNLLTIEDLQLLDGLKCADAAKQLRSMLTCRPLVIDPFSSLEFIIRPFVILLWPFEQVWEVPMGAEVIAFSDKTGVEMFTFGVLILGFLLDPTLMEWYFSFKDERHFAAICLSMEGKLVSRLQLIHIRFGRCLPRPPLALLSSQLPFTSNITQLGGQDRSGSTASPSHNERTRDRPEGSKGKIRNLTIDDLRSLDHLIRARAAEALGVSESTFKRLCRRLKIEQWPKLPPGEVIIPPDKNGEKNPSPMFITLSNNGQITTENEMGGQNLGQNTSHDSHHGHCGDVDIHFSAVYNETEVAAGSGHCGDEHLPDSFDDPNFQSIGNGLIAEFENHNTIHDSHHGHCGDADVPFSAVYNGTEVAGGSGCFLGVFESSNFTFPGAPIQPVPPILHPTPHPQIASIQFPRENMGSFEDHRNLLAPQEEPLPAGSSISDLALSQAMPITPITTESSECRRDTLTSVVGHRIGSQSVPTNPHMTPLLTERQDSTLVKVNATYGKHTIKLRLPLTSGITELKQVVSKQLKLGLDSFEVNYKDEHGEWILITLDEEVREHLQLILSGNQVNKLWVVNKVPNTTDFCRNCECEMQII